MAKKSKPRASAAEKAATAAARPNAPTAEEISEYLDRLHEINDRMDADKATHMADMKAVYDEGAKQLDMTTETLAAAYKRDRQRVKQEKKFAKADSRARDGLLKIGQAFGEESPLGQWALQMAKAAGAGTAKDSE